MKFVIYEIDERCKNRYMDTKQTFEEAEYYLKERFPFLIKRETKLYNGVQRSVYQEDIGSTRYFVIEQKHRKD